jgi:hypothetical protein
MYVRTDSGTRKRHCGPDTGLREAKQEVLAEWSYSEITLKWSQKNILAQQKLWVDSGSGSLPNV